MAQTTKDSHLAILGRLPVAVVISSVATGEILWVNERDLGLLGATSPSQIIGRSLLDFIRPDQHAAALNDIDAVSRGESPPRLLYGLMRLDGGTWDVQVSSVPLTFHETPAMLSVITDVTERERAYREIEESRERYRSLVDTLPFVVAVVVNEEIVFANASLAATLKVRTIPHLVGRHVYSFVSPSDHKLVRETRRKLLSNRIRSSSFRVTLVRENGQNFLAQLDSTRVPWRGEHATQTIVRELTTAEQDDA